MTLQADTRDEQLAVLLEQLQAAARAGHPVDLQAIAQAHPDLADELRQLWAVAQVADGWTRAWAVPAWSLSASVLPASSGPPVSAGRFSSASPDVAGTTAGLAASGAGVTVTEEGERLPRLLGDYELLRVLGRGGMGQVYLARQRSLSRLVALKMLKEGNTAAAEQARFRSEAEAAARLQHPHIVTVHEVGMVGRHAYLCMEYLQGITLAEWLRRYGTASPRAAARLAAILARAIQHAHDHHVLHRDLKPSNIFLALPPHYSPDQPFDPQQLDAWHPKVTDFGLAKCIDADHSLTHSGAVVGTPAYMAPEQAAGRKDLTPAADVYALGAILYELLTGHPPFRAAHPVDTLLLVLEQEPVPPRDLNPTVDRDLELICLKCLQKPPELRYPTAAALAADLEAYLRGEPLHAAPSDFRYFLARFFRETHHVDVLENWGRLWMWHSLMIFLLCGVTQLMAWSGWHHHLWYLALWTIGLITWATVFWQLRKAAGPVLFVERQIAHAWAAGVCACIAMFVIEWLGGFPPLTLTPAVAVAAGMVMIMKAGILSGRFYLWAALNFAAAVAMTLWTNISVLLFGLVSALSFFLPGWKYYRLRRQRTRPNT
ncbi:MAG: serine/threonine-protein kinase [Thermogemmata sp.]|nr:serine/threonine-protein kinase [Thermogemmata sp.]